MSRDALVVGINTYQYLPSLKAPARDAEAIAQQLHTYGECRVHRLPEVIQAGKPQVGQKTQVALRELETALINLFKPKGNNIPQTAVFYFSGHGIQREAGIREGYLALSDSNPDKGFYGLSLFWLRRLLQESPVRQRVVWLDCCHSGELLNFLEADPGAQSGTDRLFMAASREYETAYESLEGEYSVFTSALLSGLDPSRLPSGVISNHALTDWVNHSLKGEIQQPLFESSGSEIILTRQSKDQGKTAAPLSSQTGQSNQSSNICPYRGLEFFDESHAEYFFGREALTAQLLEKLVQDKFVAVTGSSGSGKSSLVRAGLLAQLRQGRKVTGSDAWKIRLITPTEHPLKSLASAFIDPELIDLERAEQLRRAETFLQDGGVGLAQLVRASLPSGATGLLTEQRPRFLLVIDQFEEVFTLSQGSQAERERQEFFDCLMGALDIAKDWLSLVIVLRADFLNKCSFYEGLAQQIAQHQTNVPPLKYEQIKATIVRPAQKVGLVCEPNLIYTMMMDVIGSPGELPLLQYTLLELWQHRKIGAEGGAARLTLDAYQELGGVRGTLQKRATEIFHSLNAEEQGVAKRIFLALTQLGEGTEDTRRRVMKSELVSPAFPMALVDQVLEKLVAAKLVIVSQGTAASPQAADSQAAAQAADSQAAASRPTALRLGSATLTSSISSLTAAKSGASSSSASSASSIKHFSQEIVDVTHEALIRNWSMLREWLDTGRDVLRRQRRIEQGAQEWDQMGQPTNGDYLLSGLRLRDAEDFIRLYPQELSALAEQYLSVSVTDCRRTRRQSRRSQVAVPSALAVSLLLVLSQYYRVSRSQGEQENQLQQATAHERTALAQAVLQDKDSDPMTALLLSRLATQGNGGYETQSSLRAALQNLRLQLELPGHQGAVQQIVFSPDQRRFGTAGADGTIRLWALDAGTIYNTKPKAERVLAWNTATTGQPAIQAMAFSPDGLQLAAIAKDSPTVKLWSVESGAVIQQITDAAPVKQIGFSPAGGWIAVLNQNGSLSLWQSATGLLKFRLPNSSISSFQISADGQALLSAGADGTAQLWQIAPAANSGANGLLKPSLVKTLAHPDMVYQANFSADDQAIVTLSKDGKVRQWSRKTGRLLRSLPESQAAKVASAQPKAATPQPAFRQLEISPKHLAALDSEQQIWLWNLEAGNLEAGNLEAGQVKLKLAGQEAFADAAQLAHPAANHPKANQPELLKFSPNGQMLVRASAADRHTASLWDSRTGELLGKLSGHEGGITAVQFSPDGTYVLTADAAGNLRIWSAERGGELPGLQLAGAVEWATFLPGGVMPHPTLASTLDSQTTWQKWQQSIGSQPVQAAQSAQPNVAITPMVAVAPDGQMRQWKILTDQPTPAASSSLASAPYMALIQPQTTAARLRDQMLAFWPNAQPVGQKAALGFAQLPQTAMVSPFIQQAGLAGIEKADFSGSRTALTGFALSPTGALLARADMAGGVSVYQTVANQAPILLYRLENSRSPDQADQNTQKTEPLSQVVTSQMVTSQVVTPGAVAQPKPPKPQNAQTIIRHLAFSPNGQQLLGVADDLTIRTWDARSGKAISVLRGHSATVRQARYSQDSQWIISASWDKTARIWNASTGQERNRFEHVDAVSSAGFSPDGRRAVTTSWDGGIKVWQVSTGDAKFSLDKHLKSVLDAEFSPDGKLIVTASADGTARLWDAESGIEQAVLKPNSADGQPKAVVRAFFSPDGQYVATLDQSGRVSLWAATWEMLLRLAQERSLRQLTPEECSRYLRLSPDQCPSLPL